MSRLDGEPHPDQTLAKAPLPVHEPSLVKEPPPSRPESTRHDRGWRILLINRIPGILAGLPAANQLFFLNPDRPYAPRTLARVGLVYAAIGGLISASVLTPFTRGKEGRARRLLPWTITLVLALVAITDFVLASRYTYYLPPGISRRMIKAGLWLTLLALIFFYTALLHTLQRRPYGIRSRLGLSFLAVASIYVVVERREAFKPFIGPAPLASAVELTQRPTLFVVGLGGASLDAILPLTTQGRLPFFSKLLAEGVYARPESLAPVQGEALWTTLATGRPPYKHGIVSNVVFPAGLVAEDGWISMLPTPVGTFLWNTFTSPKLIDATQRKTSAIWDVLERLDFDTGLVGWPVSDPVPEESSYGFSHRYFQGYFKAPMAQPGELAERGVLFRVAPEEIDPVLLRDLGDRVPYAFLQDLADDLWRESLTMFLLDQQQDAKAIFVMLPGLARVSSRNFGGFAAVNFSGFQREPYLGAAQRTTAYYRHLDQFLSRLWEHEAGPKILAVVSAYGFEAPEGWRRVRALATGRRTNGLYQQAPDGLFMVMGDGFRAGEFLDGVQLVDIMPTLLYSLDFPIARDLDGRVLTEAFSGAYLARHPLTVVPSYETLLPQGGFALFPLITR